VERAGDKGSTAERLYPAQKLCQGLCVRLGAVLLRFPSRGLNGAAGEAAAPKRRCRKRLGKGLRMRSMCQVKNAVCKVRVLLSLPTEENSSATHGCVLAVLASDRVAVDNPHSPNRGSKQVLSQVCRVNCRVGLQSAELSNQQQCWLRATALQSVLARQAKHVGRGLPTARVGRGRVEVRGLAPSCCHAHLAIQVGTCVETHCTQQDLQSWADPNSARCQRGPSIGTS